MTRWARATALAAALATAPALLADAEPAGAHAEVVSASPRHGATLERAPRTVRIAFSQQIRDGSARVTRAGREVQRSSGRDPRNVRRLRAALRGGLGAGRYTVRWKITAADGHVQRGTLRFRVR